MHNKSNTKNLPNVSRMKKRADFLRLRDAGKTVVKKSFILQYAPTCSNKGVEIGFTATKKIGNATIRNKAKRRLREAIAKKYLQLQESCDIVLIARASTAERTWDKLVKDLDDALSEAGLLK
ncbi:MAG: ribonuclease P protein component [Alphaproteobacteria bacterium]